MVTKVNSTGVVRNIQDEYESDKSNFDAYLAAGDTPKKPPKNVAKETQNVGVNDNPMSAAQIDGAEDFDIDNAVFNLPETLEDIEGTETFIDKVKSGVDRLLRMIKNFAIWVGELIFNKTTRIKNKLYSLKQDIRKLGPNFNDNVRYPASIVRLMDRPKVGSNTIWVNDNLAKVKEFFDHSLKGMEGLKSLAQPITGVYTDQQVLEDVKRFAESYAGNIQATTKDNKTLLVELVGFRNITVNIPNSPRLSDTNVSLRLSQRPRFVLPDFIPDISVVNKMIIQLDIMVNNLAKYHRSQTAASRVFEQYVRTLMTSTQYADKSSQANAKRFYTWLISFYHSSVSSSLSYVYDALFAAVEFCHANLRSAK